MVRFAYSVQQDRTVPKRASEIKHNLSHDTSDELLMQAYQQGNSHAFEILYARHKGPLFRYVLRFVQQNEEAEHVFQDAWLKVIQAAPRYAVTAKFTTWIYRIMHNCAIDHIRKHQKHLIIAEEDAPEPVAARVVEPENETSNAEVQAAFQSALAALPYDQREAWLLKEEHNFSIEQIADIVGIAPEAAKSRVRYASKKLRDALATMVVV